MASDDLRVKIPYYNSILPNAPDVKQITKKTRKRYVFMRIHAVFRGTF